MKLTQKERDQFDRLVSKWDRADAVGEMKTYVQHGTTSTYEHCLAVAYYSFWLARRLPLCFRYRSLIRAALLHDYYLYDWHQKGHKGHGFSHPDCAADNARDRLRLPLFEQSIIRTHMFPLTLTKVPRSREAVVVCLIDKFCGLTETLHIPYRTLHRK